ncbi:MAG: InlB B-repeat-containing protein [Clostridia bacterium]|nr:InlB B-repeat-containing protein [Clostridia bacterium]
MKKVLAVIVALVMLLPVFSMGSFASYTVDTATNLPKLTESPEIYYIANDATSYGDYIRAYYINSEEIIEMQREIATLGEEEYLKKYGFGISTEENSYDYASIEFYVQFSYSFDNVNWINDSDYENENDTYWLPDSIKNTENASQYDYIQLPNGSSTYDRFEYIRIFDLTYLTEWYYSGYHERLASNMTQGNAFRINANDEDTGYSVNFNNKTLYVKARYRVWYNTYVDRQRAYNVFYSPWSDTVSYNNSSKGLTFTMPEEGNLTAAPVIRHFRTTKSGDTSYYYISVDYPDIIKKATAAAYAAYYNLDDTYDIFLDDDYYWYQNIQFEFRVNDGEWYEYSTQGPAYSEVDFSNVWLTEFFEDEGIEYTQGDTVYLRARVIIGDYDYGEYGKVPNDETYWISEYSEPIVIPLDGYYRINYYMNSGDFSYGADILRQFTEESTVVIDLTSEDYIPTRYGYKFEGWYTTSDFQDGTKITSIDTSAEKNHTIYAKWSATEYDITYVTNTKRYVYNYNRTLVTTYMDDETLRAPSCTGLTFLGWYTTPDFKEGTEITTIKCSELTSDITLYMKWNIPTYTITYELDGGTNAADNPTSFTVDIDDEDNYINIKAPAKTGMLFDGWYYYDDFSGALTKTDEGYNMHRYGKNITLYAKWIKGRYDINYIQPEALVNVYNPNPSQYTYGDTVTLRELSHTGYVFNGWFMDFALTQAAAGITALDEGEKTFYAKWKENEYNITYIHDTIEELAPPSEKINNSNPATRLYSQKVILSDPYTGDGIFEFMGWYNNVNFQGEKITEISANRAEHTTLYAKWFVYQWGDIDLDGSVSSADARLALRNSVGLEDIKGRAFHWGDIDADGIMSSADARNILRMSVALEDAVSLSLPLLPPAIEAELNK